MKYDGHVHTPYCPHGSTDKIEEYIEQAIKSHFAEISFTEHAPLPKVFHDPTPEKDSGMKIEHVEEYFDTLTKLKQQYEKKVKINIGFEVDYIIGFEQETKKILNQYGPLLDDSILSVHFLNMNDQYFCLDYSPDEFGMMVTKFGSIEDIYRNYYSTIRNSIVADLGPFKPKRIGHMTLVHKFQKCYPCPQHFENQIYEILDLLKKHKLQLDYNGAGAVKPYCLEPYPPNWVILKAIEYNIPLVYGSDAHSASGIGQGFKHLLKGATLVSPTTT